MKEQENAVAKVNKIISIIIVAIDIIVGMNCVYKGDFSVMGVVSIIASLISAVLFFSIGEIIQKLENIDNNTKNKNCNKKNYSID